jgi:ferrochelatase
VLPELARKGTKHVVVVCPAFVADCLETLEEIGIRAVDLFRDAGGTSLRLVPSLNSEPDWADAVAKLVKGDGFR